ESKDGCGGQGAARRHRGQGGRRERTARALREARQELRGPGADVHVHGDGRAGTGAGRQVGMRLRGCRRAALPGRRPRGARGEVQVGAVTTRLAWRAPSTSGRTRPRPAPRAAPDDAVAADPAPLAEPRTIPGGAFLLPARDVAVSDLRPIRVANRYPKGSS